MLGFGDFLIKKTKENGHDIGTPAQLLSIPSLNNNGFRLQLGNILQSENPSFFCKCQEKNFAVKEKNDQGILCAKLIKNDMKKAGCLPKTVEGK